MAREEAAFIEQDPVGEELPPRVRPGLYKACCFAVELGKSFGNRESAFVRFRIPEGDHGGIELFMACTFSRKRLTYRHKYHQQWTIANGGQPKKGQRLSRKTFLNKWFIVEVRDTKRRYQGGLIMEDFFQYSVVERIIERFTG